MDPFLFRLLLTTPVLGSSKASQLFEERQLLSLQTCWGNTYTAHCIHSKRIQKVFIPMNQYMDKLKYCIHVEICIGFLLI